MPRPKPGTSVPDNRDLFDDADDGYDATHEPDVAVMWGGATDAETIERVRRGCVAVDWSDR